MDISVQNQGSIVLLEPTSEAGREWLQENIGPGNGYQPYWPTAIVEPRYVEPIMEGMIEDGLEVELA